MAELPTITLALYAQTDVGMVRGGNEDNFLILDLSSGNSWTASDEEPKELLTYPQGYYGSLLAVSDGMGGALAGEVASRMAVETVRDRMLQLQAHEVYSKVSFPERLRLSIEEANLMINDESLNNPAHKGLGATFTAVAVNGNQIFFAQVGDSRAYLLRHGNISRITKDQSLVQQLIDAGQITEEEAETHSYRNVILQALGAHNNVNVEVNKVNLCQLDTLILCSDGLSGKINQHEIAKIVTEASDLKSACAALVNMANERGGEDNITVVIAQFSGNGLPLPNNDNVEPQSLARSPDTPTEINWGIGAKTDPLNVATEERIAEPVSEASKKTEPLPSPPTESTPFTAAMQRGSAEPARTNDLSDRRGPITSVFSAADFEEDTEVKVEAPARTSPIEMKRTSPLEEPSPVDGPDPIRGSNGADDAAKSETAEGSTRINILLIGGLIIIGVAIVLGATSYFKRQAQERDALAEAEMKRQQDYLNQKDSQIVQLREKIAEITRKLKAIDRPALKEKSLLWQESLNKLSLRLDEVDKIPADQLQQISQDCSEIDKELRKIEEEVNSLQGLIPFSNREPVKV
ncbi:MAG: protein phosphatase 2C domain-containing protein [Acidobacteriota bacterium]|nr:MAG: protein phosphatase 2C domain-containing protein [Acidobacteriota bacterium]